jgi:uncharacterized protein YjdB
MKKRWKKAAVCILSLVLMTGVGQVAKAAPESTVLGTEQGQVSLSLEQGVLTVKGTGEFSSTAANLLGREKISDIQEIRVEAGVTKLGVAAFRDCVNLTKVTFPESLTEIGAGAFWGCSSLEGVTFPKSLRTIGNSAFRDCGSLAEVVMPSGLLEIQGFAFYRCKGLTSVELPDSVENLGTGAFQECDALESVKLGEGITKLPIQLFRGCRKLSKVTLGKAVEEIGQQSFYGCVSLKSFIVPESVILIEKHAFAGCGDLNLSMGEDLEDQGDGSYRKRGGLKIQGMLLYSQAERMLELVNKERALEGLSPLVMDGELLEAAMLRSAELNVLYSSQRPNGAPFDSVCRKAKQENILSGVMTPGEAMAIWMESPGYRAAILDKEAKSIGIGCFDQGETRCWVQLFSDAEAEKGEKKHDIAKVMDIRVAKGEYQFYLKKKELSLKTGEETTIQVLLKNPGFDKTPAYISPKTFTFRSSDPSVAKVEADGTVTARKGGNAVITISSNYGDGQKLTLKIHVKSKVQTIRLPKTLKLAIGKVYRLEPVVLPEDAENKKLTYKSSAPKIVSVDKKGRLQAKQTGTATITCASSDGSRKKAAIRVTVKNYASEVQLVNGENTMTVGSSQILKAQVFPENAINTQVQYRSSDKKVAVVDAKGRIKAKKPGKVTITCKAKYGAGAEDSLTIIVTPKAPVLKAKAQKGKISLSWNQPKGAVRFSLYCSRQPDSGFQRIYSGKGRGYEWKKVKKGDYYFKVRCMTKIGKKNVNSPFGKVLHVTVK